MNIFSKIGEGIENLRALAQLAKYARATAAERDIESVVKQCVRLNADYQRIVYPVDGSIKNSWARASGKIVRDNIKRLKLTVIRNEKVQEKGRLVDFVKEPAPKITFSRWISRAIGYYIAYGSHLWLRYEPLELGRKFYLLNVPRNRVTVNRNGSVDKIARLVNPVSSIQLDGTPLSLDDCIYTYEDDWEGGVQGVSPLESVIHDMSTDTGSSAFQDYFVHNRSTMSGIISPKDSSATGGVVDSGVGKGALDSAVKLLKRRGRGIKNAAKIVGVDTPVQFTQLSLPQSDAQLLEFRKIARENIAVAMGIPVALFISGEVTYENLDQAKRMLWEFTLIPLLADFQETLNLFVAPLEGAEYSFLFDLSGVEALKPLWDKAGDTAKKWEGFLSDNWIRKLIAPVELPPSADGDTIWKPANMVPVDTMAPPDTARSVVDHNGRRYRYEGDRKSRPRVVVNSKALDLVFNQEPVNQEPLNKVLGEDVNEPTSRKRLDAAGFLGIERESVFVRVRNKTAGNETGIVKRMRSILRKQRREVLKFVKGKLDAGESLPSVEDWLDWGEVDLETLEGSGEKQKFANQLRPSIVQSMEDGGKEVLADLNPDIKFNLTKKDIDTAREKSLFHSDKINDTTIIHLKRALDKIGYIQKAEGEEPSEEEILEAVGEVYSERKIDWRVAMIAVTVAHYGVQYGIHEGIRQGGGKARQWIANFGLNTRSWHESGDGQIVALDEPFISGLGNEIPVFGGSGIGAEDINCQCTEWFVRS